MRNIVVVTIFFSTICFENVFANEREDVYLSQGILLGLSGAALNEVHGVWGDVSGHIGYINCFSNGSACFRLNLDISITDFRMGFGGALRLGAEKYLSTNRDAFSLIIDGEVKVLPDDFGETIFRVAVLAGLGVSLKPWEYGARIKIEILFLAGFESRETGMNQGGAVRYGLRINFSLLFPLEFKTREKKIFKRDIEHG